MDLADLPGPADWGQEDPRASRGKRTGAPRKKSSSGGERGGRGVKDKFPKNQKKKSLFRRLVSAVFWLGLAGLVMGVVALVGGYAYFSQDLPPVDGLLKNYAPPTVTYVYSDDGRVIGEYYHERRFVAPISDIPPHVLNAFIAVEDADFYQHHGVNPKAIIRAFIANWREGKTVQGGSTITQQVAKNFLLTREKSYFRKIREMILALRMEKVFAKEEILYLYLNDIYLGQQAYGVEGAARTYYGKSAKDMSVAEAAILAGLVQAPGANNPVKDPEQARIRQLFAIRRMVDVGLLAQPEADAASAEKVEVRTSWPNVNTEVTPYFTEQVRRLMVERIGEESLYNDGWKIYTTVNIEAQHAADRAVARGLWEYSRRRSYKKFDDPLTEAQIEPFLVQQTRKLDGDALQYDRLYQAVVTEVDTAKTALGVRVGPFAGRVEKKNLSWGIKGSLKQSFIRGDLVWVRLSDENKKSETAGSSASGRLGLDLILERQTDCQAALMSVDLDNGDVKALVGGRDFSESQFNRATQSQRQPGSSFKPLLYASAMDHGFTPGSVMVDAPVVIDDVGSRRRWKPVNSDLKFKGPMTLYTALVGSRNLISIKLLDRIGFEALEETVRALGITETLPRSLTIALGSYGIKMPELLSAYTAFANMGVRVAPRYITRIEDRHGNVVETFEPERVPSLDPGTACAVTWMLRGVGEQGTGTTIKPLGRPVGAKTGTTNDYSDAWVVGFTPELATAVWIGTDQQRPRAVGEVGGRVAGPIFLYYMRDVLKDKPVRDFIVPPEAEIAPGGAFGVCYKAGTVGTGLSETVGAGNAEEEFLREDFGGDLADTFFSSDGGANDGVYNGAVYDGSVDVPVRSDPPAETSPRTGTPLTRPSDVSTRTNSPGPRPADVSGSGGQTAPRSYDGSSGGQPVRRSYDGSVGSPRDNASGGTTRLRTYGEEAAERARQAEEQARQAAERDNLNLQAPPADGAPLVEPGRSAPSAAPLPPSGPREHDDRDSMAEPALDGGDFDSDDYLRGYGN